MSSGIWESGIEWFFFCKQWSLPTDPTKSLLSIYSSKIGVLRGDSQTSFQRADASWWVLFIRPYQVCQAERPCGEAVGWGLITIVVLRLSKGSRVAPAPSIEIRRKQTNNPINQYLASCCCSCFTGDDGKKYWSSKAWFLYRLMPKRLKSLL